MQHPAESHAEIYRFPLTPTDKPLAFASVKRITTEELRRSLTEVRQSVEEGNRWLVTFHDKPRFAIVPVSDLELIQQAESKRAKAPKK